MNLKNIDIDKLEVLPARLGRSVHITPALNIERRYQYKWWNHSRWNSEGWKKARKIMQNSEGNYIDDLTSKVVKLIPKEERPLQQIKEYIPRLIIGKRTGVVMQLGMYGCPNRHGHECNLYVDFDGVIKKVKRIKHPRGRFDARKHYSTKTKSRARNKEQRITRKKESFLALTLINYPDLLKEYHNVVATYTLARRESYSSFSYYAESRREYYRQQAKENMEKAKKVYNEILDNPDVLIDIANKKAIEAIEYDKRVFRNLAQNALDQNKKRLEHVARLKKQFPELLTEPTGKLTFVIIEKQVPTVK